MAFPLLLQEYILEGKKFQLFEPDKSVVENSYRKGEISFPYWSQVWPAAIGLSHFLIQYPHYTENKKVLELAAGLGLPSVVASGNAASVLASDYATEAIITIEQTVLYNHIHNMQVQLIDWNYLPDNLTTDVLLLSDVSYDSSLFAVQKKVILTFLEKNTTVIISTPQRLIAKDAITPLLSFCKFQQEIMVMHSGREVAVSIMVLKS